MSLPIPASFDPFKAHPFTSGGVAASPPTAATPPAPAPPHILAPQPRRSPSASPPAPQPVFTRFELERRTPELVVKKLGGSWGVQQELPRK